MPLARYQIRNEYGLADPELYKAAERDDPEALLEGVAMAGLVGVLRQLGDLAEFAAEIFHDLHEEVMATAARGHGLVARVQQLETDFPSIEKAFLSQTSHSPFFSAPGIDWHPNLRSEQNLVTRGDLPRFVMDSYEECRGPPRLFLLDKYDVAGAGACLKRYTDPSFFKVEAKSNEVPTGDVHREKKVRKMKKKAARVRNGETSGAGPASHAKLHQLLMKERIENGNNDSARAVKLKKRHLNGYPFDAETGKSYMVQFVDTPSPEHKVVHEVPASPPRLKFRSYNHTSKTEKDASEMSPPRNERSPPYDPEPEVLYRPSIDDVKEVVDRSSDVLPVLSSDGETDEIPSSPPESMDKTMYAVGGKGGKEGSVDGYLSDDVASEVDNYMDALTTMESEMETDNERRIKNDLGFLNLEKHGMDSDSYEEQLESIANSSSANENGSLKKGMSSISYSDTSSNLADNTPSDGDEADKVLPSNKPCIADAPSNKLSTSEILESKSDELEVPNNMCIEEVKIPDSSGTSTSNKLFTSEILEPKSDRLEVPKDTFVEEAGIPDTRATSCVSAELVESLISDRTQFVTIASNGDGTEINLADSSDVFSSIPSQNGDHILFAVPDETNNVNKFDDGGLGVTSDASLHLSNISEGAREKGGSEYSGSEVPAIDADRYLTENFDGGEIGSAYSVSSVDEQQICLALPEVETSSVIKLVHSIPASIASCSDSLKLDDIVTEVDHAIPSTEANSEKLAPMAVDSESRKSTEEQLSGIPDDVPEHDRDLDERSDTVDGQETGRPGCSVDDEEREVDPLEVPCNLYKYADHEDRANLGDMITETVQAVDAALSFASAASPDDGIIDVISSSSDIVSSPGNLVSFHEFLSDFGGQHQGGLELNEISPGCLVEPEVKQEATQFEFASIDSESAPKNSASYTEDVSVTEQDHNSSHVGDVTTTSLISQLRTQVVPEPISPQPDDLLENSEDAPPSATSLQETGVPSQQFSRFQLDEVHIENLKVDKEQLQSPTYKDRELPFDVSKSSPEDQPAISKLSPQPADLELGFAGKAIDLSDPIPGLTEVVPGNHASPACGSEDLPSQSSPLEFLPQSSIHEPDDRTKQAIAITDFSLPNFGMHSAATQVSRSAGDGLDSSLPLFGSFPESTPDHLEMPPLPPLPPMQWRMGKVHNSPFPSLGGSFQFSQDSCNMALSSTDEKAKSGFLSEREILQPHNPFVPHTAVEDERSQHNYMVNDLAGEGRQSQDSFLTFPTTSDDVETHDFHTPGGEKAQSSYIPPPLPVFGDSTSGHDPVSSEGHLVQPLNQSPTETASDAETIQHISKDLEGQGDASPNTFAPPQSLEDEQPQNGLTIGEIAWYSKASAFVPFEVPKPNGNSTMKIPRPRSPLIDAVAAHDKSTLRKVTERARPQIEPKVDERDSLLEQIRMKSFNLKPAVVTRPSIQGPKTNLKVAAILEKANAIRQALAGSDDEDDADSWSDS